MLLFADDAARSLRGSWDLLQRRADGLNWFDFSADGFWRSFGAIAVSGPAFVAMVAGERADLGLLEPGSSLFADNAPIWRALVDFLCIWAAPPLAGLALAHVLGLRKRLVALIIALNWSGAMAAGFLALPALLYAGGLAPRGLVVVYIATAAALVANLQWFAAKTILNVSGGVALVFVLGQAGLSALLRSALT
jgi:hypothetical protein